MSSTYVETASETFTIVHARYISSKVATDLMRFHRLYGGEPSLSLINKFEAELVQLLKYDVVERVIYGFKRNGMWTAAAVRYDALPGGRLLIDDDPGKIRPGLDIGGAHFTSLLTNNARWFSLTSAEQTAIEAGCPFQRPLGPASELEKGAWVADLNYMAGGRGLGRSGVQL